MIGNGKKLVEFFISVDHVSSSYKKTSVCLPLTHLGI